MSLSVFKFRIVSAISALFLVFCLLTNLQGSDFSGDQNKDTSVRKYAFYTAFKGETPYSIARKFNLSLDDFYKYNPEFKSGIHPGDQVRIPTPFSIRQEGKAGGIQLVKYEVGRRETLYAIAKMFNTTQDEILKINPSVTGILSKGTVLTIPSGTSAGTIAKKEVGDSVEITAQKIETAAANNAPQKEVTVQKGGVQQKKGKALREGLSPKDIISHATVLFKKVFPQKKDSLSRNAVNDRKEKDILLAKEVPASNDIVRQKVVPASAEITTSGALPAIKDGAFQKKSVSQEVILSKKASEPAAFSEYTIVKGDNYFQLLQRMGISQAELEQLNPSLKDGFKLGVVIKLPATKLSENKLNNDGDSKVTNEPVKTLADTPPNTSPDLNKTFEIGVYLPFCQNLSDSARLSLRSNSFVEFYSGLLLATERLSELGMKLKLFVYDTYHDSDVVNLLVKNPEFLTLDLIIGPVYPNDQKIITELSFKNHIPVVSPLSPDPRFVSLIPGYYLINPGKRVRLASTADYVLQNFAGQNIILLNHGSNSDDEIYLLDRLSQKDVKVKSYNILTEEALGLEGLVNDSIGNVFVLAEGSEANVSVAMTRLNTLSKTHKIKVIGLQEFVKMQSIDIESFHNTNMHFVAPYFIDYNNSRVLNFIEMYRATFQSEPTQYSFQGYDVALHFISSLGKAGKGFPATNPSPGVELLQADYDFVKPAPLGGYTNRMLYVIEYTTGYDVRVVEKIKGTFLSDHRSGKESEKE